MWRSGEEVGLATAKGDREREAVRAAERRIDDAMRVDALDVKGAGYGNWVDGFSAGGGITGQIDSKHCAVRRGQELLVAD